MAAPEGNQFWKNRSKHGRDKLFETPELLLEAAYEYFQWCDDNPWSTEESTIKLTDHTTEKTTKNKPTQRPYSLDGFRLYVGASESWLREFKKTAEDDFLRVIDEIETIIVLNQKEGAIVGAYNANIIARILGLSESTVNKNINLNTEELTPEQIKEKVKKLEDDY